MAKFAIRSRSSVFLPFRDILIHPYRLDHPSFGIHDDPVSGQDVYHLPIPTDGPVFILLK